MQALAGVVGMSSELDNVARALYNGNIPQIWRRLAPATLKTLGNWMMHFQQRFDQYHQWVTIISIITATTTTKEEIIVMLSQSYC